MKNAIIKVGFLISYDWGLLKNALPNIYNDADIIYLALDKKRLTWSGNLFDFDEIAFKQLIKDIDINHKIIIYEDDFYQQNRTSMQCEVRERNLLAQQMGENGWHIQLDVDEYFIDFKGFTDYIKKINPNPQATQKAINICVGWINLFKKTQNHYLCIENNSNNLESIQVATNVPIYENGRRNGNFNHYSSFFMIHDTWARTEQEVWQKISNWGHKTDFDIQKYFEFWKNLDENNYEEVKNFHPIQPNVWQKLTLVNANNIEEVIKNIKVPYFANNMIYNFKRKMKNNRNIARLKSLWAKIF
jgi:hypothetical protein